MAGDDLDEAFDALVGELAWPMAVVTTVAGPETSGPGTTGPGPGRTGSRGGEGGRAGCLVGFHGQCSIEPRRYVVWLSRANRTYAVARAAEVFAVHLLGRGEIALAELFGSETGDEVDKFASCPWTAGPGGVPLLDDCPNRFVGRRVSSAEVGGDHLAVVLAPVAVDRRGIDRPLTLPDLAGLEPGHAAGR